MIWRTGWGPPRLSLDATGSLRDAGAMAQLQYSFGEPRLLEPDGGSGMPGGLRGYVPDSTVGRRVEGGKRAAFKLGPSARLAFIPGRGWEWSPSLPGTLPTPLCGWDNPLQGQGGGGRSCRVPLGWPAAPVALDTRVFTPTLFRFPKELLLFTPCWCLFQGQEKNEFFPFRLPLLGAYLEVPSIFQHPVKSPWFPVGSHHPTPSRRITVTQSLISNPQGCQWRP